MKYIALIIILFLSIGQLSCHTPPADVQKSFKEKFPHVYKVHWGKENATEWEAEFLKDGKKLSANFSTEGKWLETEQSIPVTGFPKPVREAIAKLYPDWKITEADRTETSKNGLIYEADLKSGIKKKSAAFKEDGTPVIE